MTAKSLTDGSVNRAAPAKGTVGRPTTTGAASVESAALKPRVCTEALSSGAVKGAAIAPGSIYAGALGEVRLHSTPIVDADTVQHFGGVGFHRTSETNHCHSIRSLS